MGFGHSSVGEESACNAGDPGEGIGYLLQYSWAPLVCSSAGKESACNVGDVGSIPGWGRSLGERKGYPLQYSGLENSMDCIVHAVTKSQTRLGGLRFHFLLSTGSGGQTSVFVASGLSTWGLRALEQRLSSGVRRA